ncbi:MAG TPA: OmpA family protein [Candidatus Limnocylindria bacterium]|nr:OmpA family protein [Candidatus Limnocylindria bacterium]
MPKSTWVFAGILSALVIIGALGFSLREARQDTKSALAAAEEAKLQAEQASSMTNRMQVELSALKSESEILAQKIKDTQEERFGLEQQLRAELESKDVAISQLQGRLTFNILDRVLFDSGRAALKPEGETILLKIAKFLGAVTNREVQVVGHTDNVPIHNRTADGFTDNWSLSAGRAIAAVRFLQEKGGVAPKRLSAVGCGEFRPVASNDTPEGKTKNRRIAVVVLPDKLVADDTTKADAATNAPPALLHAGSTNAPTAGETPAPTVTPPPK